MTLPPPLYLRSSMLLEMKAGQFNVGASRDGNMLEVPIRLMNFAAMCDIETAADLVNFALDFPNTVAEAFGWTVEQARNAAIILRNELRDRNLIAVDVGQTSQDHAFNSSFI